MTATIHYELNGEEQAFSCGMLATIGRVDTNDISISDPRISRSHAVLRYLGDGKYYLMDVGSANGTFVNGQRIIIPVALKNGDEISVGSHVLVFQQEVEEEAVVEQAEQAFDATPTIVTNKREAQLITILVADIRGYTAMAEEIPVALLASILGKWFRVASEIVEQNSGIVDKLIGDAIMVRWPTSKEKIRESVVLALNTAHEMKVASEELSEEFTEWPHALKIGVGINTGRAMVGNVGASSIRDYTAVGDAVNLAFRFETASKQLEKDLVIGPDSYETVPEIIRAVRKQSIMVKGKVRPITICALSFEELGDEVERIRSADEHQLPSPLGQTQFIKYDDLDDQDPGEGPNTQLDKDS